MFYDIFTEFLKRLHFLDHPAETLHYVLLISDTPYCSNFYTVYGEAANIVVAVVANPNLLATQLGQEMLERSNKIGLVYMRLLTFWYF